MKISKYYVVIESETTVVYPSDESPPWILDPSRFKKRGHTRYREAFP